MGTSPRSRAALLTDAIIDRVESQARTTDSTIGEALAGRAELALGRSQPAAALRFAESALPHLLPQSHSYAISCIVIARALGLLRVADELVERAWRVALTAMELHGSNAEADAWREYARDLMSRGHASEAAATRARADAIERHPQH